MTKDSSRREWETRVYRSLRRIRRVEEDLARVYPTDCIKSPLHLSIGQEAVSVGVCEALGAGDVAFGTYRGHALYLAKGGNLRAMFAELYGKATGCSKGKGGSMHLVDAQAGMMGGSGVVATTIPLAVGYAYAQRVKKTNRVVASFFGDGAMEEGAFHEAANFAAVKSLPVLFVCENNLYAIHSHQRGRQVGQALYERARSYGMRAERIEGNDVERIYEKAAAAVSVMREGKGGPVFLECMTYRWREHVGPNEDFAMGYRTREEATPWLTNDAVARAASWLPDGVRAEVDAQVEAEIVDAHAFAEASPWPEASALYDDVYGAR
jgi:TPP-dependent pyruvate/acetoin dehydrogenase alpha subunit